jgi:hypothetical protein
MILFVTVLTPCGKIVPAVDITTAAAPSNSFPVFNGGGQGGPCSKDDAW